MLKSFNGFKTLQISIDPDGKNPHVFDRVCYQYPIDLEKTKWLIKEVNQHKEYAKERLSQSGFDNTEIEGFVPLYGRRALAVLKDKTKSPVLSILGSDIIIYGEPLIQCWCNQLYVEFKY